LFDKPPGVTSLDLCEIDWNRTLAWGAGGYYGRLSLNIQGREPQGTLPVDQVDAFKAKLSSELEAIPDPDGNPIGTRVLRPEQIYAQVNNIPPDLIVYFGDLAWRSVGSVGNEAIHVFENDTGPDDANHAQHGMYIFNQGSAARADRTWRAIAPTMLESLGLDVPDHMGEERLG
jgi:predicted AlkP superfamily phosphohydrolase/phosphomutase